MYSTLIADLIKAVISYKTGCFLRTAAARVLPQVLVGEPPAVHQCG